MKFKPGRTMSRFLFCLPPSTKLVKLPDDGGVRVHREGRKFYMTVPKRLLEKHPIMGITPVEGFTAKLVKRAQAFGKRLQCGEFDA
jgi:hypothetical protein